MTSGIYIIENSNRPGKVYVGSAADLEVRKRNHLRLLNTGMHHSIKLQRAYKKHGASAFAIRTLIICRSADLLFYEQRAIDAYRAVCDGYNINPTAGSNYGRRWSAEVRKKMSLARKGKSIKQPCGKKASAEHRANISAALKGKIRSPEHCAKIAEAKKGAVLSSETRNKMSIVRRGKKQTQETIAKRNATLSRIRETRGIPINSMRSSTTGRFEQKPSPGSTTITTDASKTVKTEVTK